MSKIKYHVTNVKKLVDRKQPKLAGKINRILKKAAQEIADKASKLYATKLIKSDDTDAIIQKILDELELSDLSVDMVDSITPELIRAFKEAGILGIDQVKINATDDMTNHLDQKAMDYVETRGAELIDDLTETTLNDLRDILAQGVEEGMSPDELSDAIQEMGGFGEARGDMIARTELAFAHVQGNVAGWRETGMVEGKRSLLGDLHTVEDECDDCVLAGVVPLDEDFIAGYNFPPYHPNACFEGTSFIPYGELKQIVRARYSGPAIMLETEMCSDFIEEFSGNSKVAPDLSNLSTIGKLKKCLLKLFERNINKSTLTISPSRINIPIGPNHPMLTNRGFIAANLINEGDEVIYDTLCNNSLTSAGKFNFDQMMSFEDAFSTLLLSCKNTIISAAAKYFHGDEEFVYGEVDVIRPKRRLLSIFNSMGIKHLGEDNFVISDTSLMSVSSDCSRLLNLKGINFSAPSSMSGIDLFNSLLGGIGGPNRFHRFRVVASHKTSFSGYAFDASTESGLYNNNGLVVKNCMCDVVPVLIGEEADGADTIDEGELE